ncbi:MAG: hypothetical protein A2148_08010 [Chloroflexi bacterium RBG_16_68_14]|nr:MAG: hypothetical protein A2148_08010 [Chloroflexi bacterium RBG_16_68_14]
MLRSSRLRYRRRCHRGERGQIFVLVVVLIAVFGGMTAVAIDLGSFTADRRDLQNAADAIALAAALELPDANDAQTVATQWAIHNDIDPVDMTVTIIPQSLPSEPNPKARVEVERDHSFTFARLVGISSATVGASATAIRTSPGGSDDLMPWSVLDSFQNAATPGVSLVLKYDSLDVQSGNFGAISVDGSGASVYRDTIKYGSDDFLCVAGASGACSYPSQIDLQTGNMVGPTRQGTDYRLEQTAPACDTWEEVVAVNPDGTQGLRPECNPFLSGGDRGSLRVIIIPVVPSLCNGSCTVEITEFALFFLEGYGSDGCTGNSCEIRGRFIDSNTNYGALAGTYDPDSYVHFVRLVE